ncbi:2Fe-2S iron-sulfur cluster-binding protein [Zavarzinia aquatilis]|uniref:Ferredoxin n=1 Tax=Zavarzinia aquatilis TaxID=2211142 RepID=A0A317E2E5_9PROT|nr:2Fe-2S iron-sulfur cluster binding domain-containing protein [Zavarzinia aquatilis]PWR19543.1 ferredoxin [Zavarzinia aquatilis]
MTRHRVTIDETGEAFTCDSRQSVLDGMVRLGRKGIPAGCRGGGCGVCKIEVVEGTYTPEVMSRAHVTEEDQRRGRVLACRIRPEGDLTVRVIGKMTKAWTPR